MNLPDDTLPTLFEFPMPIRWRDLDAFNHVNNSSYLTYLEEARVQWLALLEPNWSTVGSVPIMAAVQLNYRRPIVWPGDLLVRMFAQDRGHSSVTISHRIESPDRKILYCDGHVVLVWIDPASGSSVELPERIRALCTPASSQGAAP